MKQENNERKYQGKHGIQTVRKNFRWKLGGYSKFRQELMMTSRSGHGEQRLYEVTFLIPGLQMRKVRLRKAKDLSKLGIRVENFFY